VEEAKGFIESKEEEAAAVPVSVLTYSTEREHTYSTRTHSTEREHILQYENTFYSTRTHSTAGERLSKWAP